MIETIDCQYTQSEFAAAYLLEDSGDVAFIENNTMHAVPTLLAALEKRGLSTAQVKYIIVTHVHLDHAAGTSALLSQCPNAKVVVHPRGARHLINPEKLIQSAKVVYGEQEFARLYGTMAPIAADRVLEAADQSTIPFGKTSLKFMHTRGHANHHMCITYGDSIFTGDAFGLAYPFLQARSKRGLFIFPSTSPTDFDPKEAFKTLYLIATSGAKKAYLTHFGEVSDLKAASDMLFRHYRFSEDLLEEAKKTPHSGPGLNEFCRTKVMRFMDRELEQAGIAATKEVWDLIRLDCELNGDGIAWVAAKSR